MYVVAFDTRGAPEGFVLLGPVSDKEGKGVPDLGSGLDPEVVPAGARKTNFLKRQNDSGLGGRLIRGAWQDVGLALNGHDHLVLVVHQVGPERLGAGLVGAPFDDENDRHVFLLGREAGRAQLIKNAFDVQLAVVADLCVITRERQNQFHA